jgi:hypothetical protein
MARANSFDTGVASEYLILSMLYRLGVEAHISQGNKKNIDIRIIKENGTALSLDVKAVRGYSSLVVNNVRVLKNHFIVFVVYNNRFEIPTVMPDIFIVPSENVSKITSTFNKENRVLKGNLKNFKDKWTYIVDI